MRKKHSNKKFGFLYKLHIYGGLFVSAFFILIGITSINYNHPDWFRKDNFREHDYDRSFTFYSDDKEELIDHATDSLQIFGHRPYWLQWKDKGGNFHFQINRPGKEYKIVVVKHEKRLKVTEKNMGVMHALAGMHVSSGGMLQSDVLSIWSVYVHLSVIFGLITIVLSFYFWLRKSKITPGQWIFAGTVFIGSLSFIVYIWLIG